MSIIDYRTGMGTFHSDKGELHGITVVVDTNAATIYIGRCWEMTNERIVLLDVDQHEGAQDGRSKEDFVREAARVGVWKKHDRIELPLSGVASVKRLSEVAIQ